MTGPTGGKTEGSGGFPIWTPKGNVSASQPSSRNAQNHDEAQTFRDDKRRQVREQRNLKPGEVLVCRDSFADIARQVPRLPKAAPYAQLLQREAGIVDDLKGILHWQTGGCHLFPSVGFHDGNVLAR